VVEDAPPFAELLAEVVAREGFTPVICPNAADARAAHQREAPVAVLLDWVLPDTPGTELSRELRAADPVLTIIFISGRNDETSMARGLDAGADDYLAKPVREGELVARLEAQLRKVARLKGAFESSRETGAPPLRFGELEMDLMAREVRVGGRPVKLGPLEYRLLEYLGRNAGVAVSRDQILNEVYGITASIGTERVDLLVRRLRLKLGDYPDTGGHIVAHAGYGYLLERRAPDR
jgi:two-component system phosphate regulon response regulator PhoB